MWATAVLVPSGENGHVLPPTLRCEEKPVFAMGSMNIGVSEEHLAACPVPNLQSPTLSRYVRLLQPLVVKRLAGPHLPTRIALYIAPSNQYREGGGGGD